MAGISIGSLYQYFPDKSAIIHALAERLGEASRACGKLLAGILVRLRPGADAVELAASAFLVWQLGEARMRLAIPLGRDEGGAVVAANKRMALRELLGA